MCVVSTRVVRKNNSLRRMIWTAGDNLYLRVFSPKHVWTLSTLSTIDREAFHRITFVDFYWAYIVRNMIKGFIMLFRVLCAINITENVHESVCQIPRFQWSHEAKMPWRLVLVTITKKPIETFRLTITCYFETKVSTYLSPIRDLFAFQFEGQMILKTFLNEKPPVACGTIFRVFFKTL